jgi:hypothetical protein
VLPVSVNATMVRRPRLVAASTQEWATAEAILDSPWKKPDGPLGCP